MNKFSGEEPVSNLGKTDADEKMLKKGQRRERGRIKTRWSKRCGEITIGQNKGKKGEKSMMGRLKELTRTNA